MSNVTLKKILSLEKYHVVRTITLLYPPLFTAHTL